MAAGAVTAAVGVLTIGISTGQIIAMTAAAVMGVGTVLFTSHVLPVFCYEVLTGCWSKTCQLGSAGVPGRSV